MHGGWQLEWLDSRKRHLMSNGTEISGRSQVTRRTMMAVISIYLLFRKRPGSDCETRRMRGGLVGYPSNARDLHAMSRAWQTQRLGQAFRDERGRRDTIKEGACFNGRAIGSIDEDTTCHEQGARRQPHSSIGGHRTHICRRGSGPCLHMQQSVVWFLTLFATME